MDGLLHFGFVLFLVTAHVSYSCAQAQTATSKPQEDKVVTYSYGYDVGSHYHNENKDNNNVVRGEYGWQGPDGIFREYNYTADKYGFRISRRRSRQRPGSTIGSDPNSRTPTEPGGPVYRTSTTPSDGQSRPIPVGSFVPSNSAGSTNPPKPPTPTGSDRVFFPTNKPGTGDNGLLAHASEHNNASVPLPATEAPFTQPGAPNEGHVYNPTDTLGGRGSGSTPKSDTPNGETSQTASGGPSEYSNGGPSEPASGGTSQTGSGRTPKPDSGETSPTGSGGTPEPGNGETFQSGSGGSYENTNNQGGESFKTTSAAESGSGTGSTPPISPSQTANSGGSKPTVASQGQIGGGYGDINEGSNDTSGGFTSPPDSSTNEDFKSSPNGQNTNAQIQQVETTTSLPSQPPPYAGSTSDEFSGRHSAEPLSPKTTSDKEPLETQPSPQVLTTTTETSVPQEPSTKRPFVLLNPPVYTFGTPNYNSVGGHQGSTTPRSFSYPPPSAETPTPIYAPKPDDTQSRGINTRPGSENCQIPTTIPSNLKPNGISKEENQTPDGRVVGKYKLTFPMGFVLEIAYTAYQDPNLINEHPIPQANGSQAPSCS